MCIQLVNKCTPVFVTYPESFIKIRSDIFINIADRPVRKKKNGDHSLNSYVLFNRFRFAAKTS